MDAGAFHDEYNLESLTLARPEGWQFSMQVTPRYRHCYGDKPAEPFSARLAANAMKRAAMFVDVGAHYGFYTLLAASEHPALEVLAFEPVPENFEILQRNVTRMGLPNVKLHPAAASDADGEARFNISMASDNCSFYPHPNAPPLKQVSVPTLRIDSLLKARSPCPIFVKIDTDGHELAVLRGMAGSMDRFKDLSLLIEFNPKMQRAAGHEPEAMLRELDRLGFAMFLLDETRFLPLRLQPATNWAEFFAPQSYANLYCVRKERALSVCFFSHSAQLGGAERSLLELATELVTDHGAVCSVVLPKHGPLAEELKRSGVGVIESSYPWWCEASSATTSTDVFEHLSPGASSLLKSVVPTLARVAPDVIVTQTMVIPWGAVAAALLNKPHVWSLCEAGDTDLGYRFLIPFAEVVQSVVDCSSLIYTTSDTVGRALFPTLGPERRRTLYRHVSIPRSSPDANAPGLFAQNGAARLGIFATLIEGKGQEDAVRAVAQLIADGRNVELLLAGHSDPRYRAVLRGLIAEHGLAGRVQMPGFLSDPYPAMRETEIHIVCSRNEAFGRACVEAMLLGKPVIYTAAGSFPEYMIDGVTGLAYPPGDAAALASRVSALMDHPELMTSLGKQAQACAMAKFTRDAYGGEFYRALRSLVTSGAMPPVLSQRLKALAESAGIKISDFWNPGKIWRRLQRFHGKRRPKLVRWIETRRDRRRIEREAKIVEASGLFDHSWYLQQNPDVAAAKVDPLRHYLEAGAQEGRNPNPTFDTATYVLQHPEIVRQDANPFVHYILQTGGTRARP